jgi:hypothetical protein
VVELPQGADLERFVEAFHEAQADSRPVVLPQGSGLHLTTSPGKEWWRQLPEGASARDVATINNRPVKVNPHGVLVYDQEPVYVAGGYIRPAPPRHPLWHRVLGNWCQVHLKVWNLIKSEAYWLWGPALAGAAVVCVLVENGVWK